MTQPTPGPWTLHKYHGHVSIQQTCGHENLIGTLGHSCKHDSYDEQAANARLVAAAPDLLHACQYALPFMQARVDLQQDPEVGSYPVGEFGLAAWQYTKDVLKFLNEAIAKAGGESLLGANQRRDNNA